MSMETNLQGRLRNTSLPYSHGLLPLFEAVVNSIHGLEEAGLDSNRGEISVEVVRSPQMTLKTNSSTNKRGPDAVEDILGFKITDNGIGFNEENLRSFQTLDSDHKAEKGCRGIGRLLWLKAFKKVSIQSTYREADDKMCSRQFKFDAKSGVDNITTNSVDSSASYTTVHLDGFDDRYRKASKKTTSAIANSLFEHCLWYFVRDGGAPKISVIDSGETILLDHIAEDHMKDSAERQELIIKGQTFELTHVKLRSSSHPHVIAFCAASRLVLEESLSGKVAGLYGRLNDGLGEFSYACYVSSQYLTDNVRPERTGFDIAEDPIELLSDTVSFSEIRKSVMGNVTTFLSEHLEEARRAGRERVEKFASEKAPRYRPILARISDEQFNIDPNISDKELDVVLHRYLSDIERELIKQGHEIMVPGDGERASDYKERVQKYLETAEDIKKSDLANYVSHRKVILDLLEKAIEKREDGKYEREELIHQLIMPMRTDSGNVFPESCNLWLIDERLAFHNYLASDKTLSSMPITGSEDSKEPDLCVLNVFDNPLLVSDANNSSMASIVVIEIKRPMRNDAKAGEEKDPIEQALGYLDRIRQGGVKTASGRPIPKSESIPGFCYVLCDITPSIEQRCKLLGATRTSDNLGYFFFNPTIGAYVEVISFDRLVMAAKQRNRAFFDKLGLPTT